MLKGIFSEGKRKMVTSLIGFLCFIVILVVIANFTDIGKETKANSKRVLANALASLDVLETLNFTEDKSVFINPEKGFYSTNKDTELGNMSTARSQNFSLGLVEVNLGAFKTGPISDAKLASINNAFTVARQKGIKVIFRAAYGYTDADIAPEPADINILLNHIKQLKTIFYDNEDVLYVVQAGFLGTWGEWHSTIYGSTPYKYNDIPVTVQKQVAAALLDAVPTSRMIQIREPRQIRAINDGQLITDATAFNGSNLARIGFHDDGLFATIDDMGTYVDTNTNYNSRAKELEWANTQMKYTPFGGESDALSSYSDPANTVYEFNKLHAQYVNIEYFPSVIAKWKSTIVNGENTFNYISRNLGYKYLLTSAEVSSKVYSSGVLHLKLNIKNDGFGSLINERNLEVVLSNGTDTYKAKVNEDVRKWYRENGLMTKDLYFSIPSNIKLGNWNVYLNLPDKSDSLKNNPNYSIRLANTGVWDSTKGYNLIKSGIVIDDIGITNTNVSFAQIDRPYAEMLMGLTVGVPVSSVSLNQTNVTMEIGNTVALTATVNPTDATEKNVTFASSNPSVATVDNTGNVTSISAGTTTITVTSINGGKTATCTVKVNAPVVIPPQPVIVPVTSISITPTTLKLVKGTTSNLVTTLLPTNATNTTVSYVSSNPSVVTVDTAGKVTAISAGNAIITATSVGEGKTATTTVTVTQPVNSVSLPLQTLTMNSGETYTLTGTVNPASATNPGLTYSSSNPLVATVDNTGKVTALATGNTVITATSVDGGKTATCNITVVQTIPTDNVSSWSNINAIAERTVSNTASLKVYNNQTTLYLLVNGTNLKTKSQFYIDADNNYKTGFKTLWSSSGIEYLIENQYLYKYSGTNNSWRWTQVGSINLTKTDTLIGVSLPLSKMNLSSNSVIHVGFLRNDNRADMLPIKTLPIPAYTIGSGTSTMSF